MPGLNCKTSAGKTLLACFLGALVLGVLWRFRGSHGWGGEDGILNVGFMFLCFLVFLTGGNEKTTPFRIALTAIIFMLSTPAWGTFLNQIKGVISAGPQPLITGISPLSGVVMMLLLGFGISGLFGILLGSMFSATKWRLYHFITMIVAFIAVMYLSRVTICHPILKAIQPRAVEAFDQALAGSGVTGGAFNAYMFHFDDMPWAKEFIGGRNYVASFNTISKAIATLVCIVLTRYWIKDKTSARIGLISALSFAFAITFSDISFVLWGHTGAPALFPSEHIHPWACWEYFTGFFAGGLITYSVLKLKDSEVRKDGCLDFIPLKVRDILAFLVTFGVMGYNMINPTVLRFDGSDLRPYVFALVAAMFAVIVVVAAFKSRLGSIKLDNARFSQEVFLFLLILQSFVYFFGAGHYANFRNLPDMEHMMTLISISLIIIYMVVIISNRRKSQPSPR